MKNTYIIFEVENTSYGINVQSIVSIERVSEITKLPQAPEYMLGIMKIREQILPVIDITRLLNNRELRIDPNNNYIIVETNGLQLALMVERTEEILEIELDKLKSIPSLQQEKVRLLEEVALLEQRLISIINLENVFASLQDIESIRSQIAQVQEALIE